MKKCPGHHKTCAFHTCQARREEGTSQDAIAKREASSRCPRNPQPNTKNVQGVERSFVQAARTKPAVSFYGVLPTSSELLVVSAGMNSQGTTPTEGILQPIGARGPSLQTSASVIVPAISADNEAQTVNHDANSMAICADQETATDAEPIRTARGIAAESGSGRIELEQSADAARAPMMLPIIWPGTVTGGVAVRQPTAGIDGMHTAVGLLASPGMLALIATTTFQQNTEQQGDRGKVNGAAANEQDSEGTMNVPNRPRKATAIAAPTLHSTAMLITMTLLLGCVALVLLFMLVGVASHRQRLSRRALEVIALTSSRNRKRAYSTTPTFATSADGTSFDETTETTDRIVETDFIFSMARTAYLERETSETANAPMPYMNSSSVTNASRVFKLPMQ